MAAAAAAAVGAGRGVVAEASSIMMQRQGRLTRLHTWSDAAGKRRMAQLLDGRGPIAVVRQRSERNEEASHGRCSHLPTHLPSYGRRYCAV
jgi:hypothetical protein